MTDIRLPLGDVKFSVRVAIIVVADKGLLVNTISGSSWGFLPGGALATGEDALTCAAREWTEETGLVAGPMRLVAVIENFWVENFADLRGVVARTQHEIGFYVRMETPADVAGLPEMVVDDPDSVTAFTWVPLEQVRSRPVLPIVVADLLDIPPGEVRHLVNRDAGEGRRPVADLGRGLAGR